MLLRASLCLIMLTLTACGFRPLYGAAPQAEQIRVIKHIEEIAINNIANREGQYLRNALVDRFYKSGYPKSPRYYLTITTPSETITDLAITKSSNATRAQLRIDATMTLYDVNGQALMDRRLTSISSYNILSSQFTTRVSEDAARKNVLDDIAGQVERLLAIYFTVYEENPKEKISLPSLGETEKQISNDAIEKDTLFVPFEKSAY
jgi:LPS-assembly lipoprotein